MSAEILPKEQIYHNPQTRSPFKGFLDKFSSLSKNKITGFFVLTLLIAAVPITVFVAGKQQNTQQNASAGVLLPPAKVSQSMPQVKSNRIIVRYKNQPLNKGSVVNNQYPVFNGVKLQQVLFFPQTGVQVFQMPTNISPDTMVQQLKSQPNVEYAEVDGILTGGMIPNDPFYSSEWHLPQINEPAAWDINKGAGITIADIDSGADSTHQDLIGQFAPGWNFLNNNDDTHDVLGHGTWVAGTMVALGNNNFGVAGAVWEAKVMPLVVLNSQNFAYWSDTENAMYYAADHGIKIINISLIASNWCADDDYFMNLAAKYVHDKGGIVVYAAGNYAQNICTSNSPYIVTVGAIDKNNALTSFSNYGKNLDVVAPGIDIFTTANGGSIQSAEGTSFSAPLTASVLAQIWSVNPSLTPDQVQQILFSSAKDLGNPGWDDHFGWGLINATGATVTPTITPTPTFSPCTQSTTTCAASDKKCVSSIQYSCPTGYYCNFTSCYPGGPCTKQIQTNPPVCVPNATPTPTLTPSPTPTPILQTFQGRFIDSNLNPLTISGQKITFQSTDGSFTTSTTDSPNWTVKLPVGNYNASIDPIASYDIYTMLCYNCMVPDWYSYGKSNTFFFQVTANNTYGIFVKYVKTPTPSPTPTQTPTPTVTTAKRVFITSTFYNGNLGGLSGADAKCQTRATAANLGGTWKAWLSDDTTSAASRLNHNAGQYKLLNGTVVANNWADLTSGSLRANINVTEFNSGGGYFAWTNTQTGGMLLNNSSSSCNNWSSSSSTFLGGIGSTTSTDSTWTWNSKDVCSDSLFTLYCFEQ